MIARILQRADVVDTFGAAAYVGLSCSMVIPAVICALGVVLLTFLSLIRVLTLLVAMLL